MRKTYRSLSGIISRLPSTEHSLAHLRTSITAIPGLPTDYNDGAWGALLGSPQLIVDLPSTQLDDFLASGQVIPSKLEEGTIRRLGLAVVALPDSIALSGEHELVAAPVAGIAQLVLAARERADTSSDAWMVAHWYDSAEEAAAALANLHALSGANLPRSLPAEAVLLTDSSSVWYEDALDERIISCAALLDYRITGYKPADYARKAVLHVKRSPPDILIVADSSTSRCSAVVESYLATPKAGGLRHCESGDIDTLVPCIRRRLIVASGVSLNLLSIAREAHTESKEPRGRLPIKREGRRLHHGVFGTFIQEEETSYFYVIDRARHAHVVAKKYVMKSDGLHWEADLDENGEVVVGKFKGKVGRFIPTRELNAG